MILSPSLMCADAGHYAEQIALLEASGVDSFHIDIMDGDFVPNFALSWADVALFRRLTDLPFDAHLMVRNLTTHIQFAAKCGVRRVFVHVEHPEIHDYIDLIKSLGMEAGIAINPETPVSCLSEFSHAVNSILLMRVRPGFAGQPGLDFVDDKIPEIQKIIPKVNITVDGAVSKEVIGRLLLKGVCGYVLGTAALFNKNRKYSDIVNEIRDFVR